MFKLLFLMQTVQFLFPWCYLSVTKIALGIKVKRKKDNEIINSFKRSYDLFIKRGEKIRIPEEVWQAWEGADVIIPHPSAPSSSFSLSPRPPPRGSPPFPGNKAGHGLDALMFILASHPPCCLAFFCVHPGTTSPSPPENKPLGESCELDLGQGMSCI